MFNRPDNVPFYLRSVLSSIYFALRYQLQLFCVSSAYVLQSDMGRYTLIDAVPIQFLFPRHMRCKYELISGFDSCSPLFAT